jgi:hypothetical protein
MLERGFKKKASLFPGLFAPLYSEDHLMRVLKERFGDLGLTDSAFGTGFALLVTSLVRARPVVISNHPALDSELRQDMTVASAAFASLAFITYFAPAIVVNARGEQDALVHGEASIGPDPSLALLLLVSSPHYPFGWRMGQNQLSMTAIGYETKASGRDIISVRRGGILNFIVPLFDSLSEGSAYQTRMIMETLALEGATSDTALLKQSAAVTYRRYAPVIQDENLAQLGLKNDQDLHVAKNNDFKFIEQFARMGQAAANRDVIPSHFQSAFDVRAPVEAFHTIPHTEED